MGHGVGEGQSLDCKLQSVMGKGFWLLKDAISLDKILLFSSTENCLTSRFLGCRHVILMTLSFLDPVLCFGNPSPSHPLLAS